MTEETDWVGGQLTSQIVPPDEHPWIETLGCTERYRAYREAVRERTKATRPLTDLAMADRFLNPGSGWVSRLCHEPRIGWAVLTDALEPFIAQGLLDLRLETVPVRADVDGHAHPSPDDPDFECGLAYRAGTASRVRAVEFLDRRSGNTFVVSAPYVLDATELGDLFPMTGTGYHVGAESKADTHEPHAVEGPAEWDNVQGITWCMALALDEGSNRVIDRPANYDFWREYHPPFWPGKHLGFDVLHAHTGVVKELPLFGRRPEDWYALFPYRQIIDPDLWSEPTHPVTVVNWPQNDYFVGTILDVPEAVKAQRLQESRELSLSLLYWLQTEAPRHDGGVGYPGLYLRPDITGTDDGFAKYAYIRESRRLDAHFMVLEQLVDAGLNPGEVIAPSFRDSVGIGAYRLDLHPSTNGANTIDTSTLPFEVPLGSLVSRSTSNLIPACKNLGVTHLTNGCYRLHPIEWNIGESAALLAAYCMKTGVEPVAVLESDDHLRAYQNLLSQSGIPLRWPRFKPL
jgi:hypothetical protein